MAADAGADADFRAQTKRMVDDLARTDPAKLTELYAASQGGARAGTQPPGANPWLDVDRV